MEMNIHLQNIWQTEKENTISFFSWLQRKQTKSKILQFPKNIKEFCGGIMLDGNFIKTVLFSTDLALIENSDADAVLAVYPFPPSANIMKSLVQFSGKPLICGIGGGMTQGKKALEMAVQAESLGACAVIVNQPFKNRHIEKIKKLISIPIISSVSYSGFNFKDRVNAGVDIFHITGGSKTSEIIRHLAFAAPGYPIMATGGKSIIDIDEVVKVGADAVVLTPPSSGELFRTIMDQYRKGVNYFKW